MEGGWVKVEGVWVWDVSAPDPEDIENYKRADDRDDDGLTPEFLF